MDAPTLSGTRILVTGPTGQVALPITLALAADNDVIGIARFRDVLAPERLEAAGVTCIETNLAGSRCRCIRIDRTGSIRSTKPTSSG